MSTKSKTVSENIQELIVQVEDKNFVFQELLQHYNAAEEEEQFQFNVTDIAPCFKDVAFVKSSGEDRLASVFLELAPGHETTTAELETTFGTFRTPPPIPGGKWMAMAKYTSSNEKVSYAIIAEADAKITPETKVQSITVRLDHPE